MPPMFNDFSKSTKFHGVRTNEYELLLADSSMNYTRGYFGNLVILSCNVWMHIPLELINILQTRIMWLKRSSTIIGRVLNKVVKLVINFSIQKGCPFQLGINIELINKLQNLIIESLDKVISISNTISIFTLCRQLIGNATQRTQSCDEKPPCTKLIEGLHDFRQ